MFNICILLDFPSFDIKAGGETQAIPIENSSPKTQTKKKKPKTTGTRKIAPSPKVAPTPKEKKEEKMTNLWKGEKEIKIEREFVSADRESTNSIPDADAFKASLF